MRVKVASQPSGVFKRRWRDWSEGRRPDSAVRRSRQSNIESPVDAGTIGCVRAQDYIPSPCKERTRILSIVSSKLSGL
jgi:hypothetical protein